MEEGVHGAGKGEEGVAADGTAGAPMVAQLRARPKALHAVMLSAAGVLQKP